MKRITLNQLNKRLTVLIVFFALISARSLLAEQEASLEEPSRILEVLLEEIEAGGSGDYRPVSELGDAILPLLVREIPKAPSRSQGLLVHGIGAIKSEAATRTLLNFALNEKSRIINNAAWTELNKRRIDFEVTTTQVEQIEKMISEGSSSRAINGAAVLSNCIRIPSEDRTKPILGRMLTELQNMSFSEYGRTTSDSDTGNLTLLMYAFSKIGSGAIPVLRQAFDETKDRMILEWLTIARGFAGDKSIAEDLREMVFAKTNIQERVVSILAYARSTEAEAISVLESLLQDETVIQGHFGTEKPIASTAWSEIKRLKGEKKIEIQIGPPPQ